MVWARLPGAGGLREGALISSSVSDGLEMSYRCIFLPPLAPRFPVTKQRGGTCPGNALYVCISVLMLLVQQVCVLERPCSSVQKTEEP